MSPEEWRGWLPRSTVSIISILSLIVLRLSGIPSSLEKCLWLEVEEIHFVTSNKHDFTERNICEFRLAMRLINYFVVFEESIGLRIMGMTKFKPIYFIFY